MFAPVIFFNGQPKMDKGLTNPVLISLFTTPWYVGNYLEADVTKHIGTGKFLSASGKAITVSNLNDIRIGAEADLDWMLQKGLAGAIDINVTNPGGYTVQTDIIITPPAGSVEQLRLSNEGQRWIAQILNPVTFDTLETYTYLLEATL